MGRSFQQLPYGILYFSLAQKSIEFDNLFVWYCVFKKQNQKQNSDHIFYQIYLQFGWNPLMYFDVVVER